MLLVVEDDDLVAELAAGCSTSSATSRGDGAKEALDRLGSGDRQEASSPTSDARRNERPGARATSARRFPELPILLTTGYSEHAIATTASSAAEPYELKSLAVALGNVLKPQPSQGKLGTDD